MKFRLVLAMLCALLLGGYGAYGAAGTGDPAVRFIEQFYADAVFGGQSDAVEPHCTKQLCDRLRAAYTAEYDGEGYAIWRFRSGAQDGPSDQSRVTSVKRLGKGRYRVEFLDMGIEGARTLKLVTRGGKLFFDAIEE